MPKDQDIVVVIGEGPNSVQIPILVFESTDAAYQYLEQICNSTIDRKQRLYISETYDSKNKILLFQFSNWIDFYTNKKVGDQFPSTKLLKSYYGGCGEIGSLSIKTIKFGEIFATWNLD